MTPEQSISLFSTGFYIFLGIAVIGFGLAAFFFFRFRIPEVYALMTGRARKKTIEKMQRSGQLRSQEEIEAEQAERAQRSLNLGTTGQYVTETIAKANPTHDQTEPFGYQSSESQETTVLDSEQETTVLAPEQETTVLQQAASPMTAYIGETEDVGINSVRQFDVTDRTERINRMYGNAESDDDPLTTVLGDTQQYQFESTEHTVVIHTDEIIS